MLYLCFVFMIFIKQFETLFLHLFFLILLLYDVISVAQPDVTRLPGCARFSSDRSFRNTRVQIPRGSARPLWGEDTNRAHPRPTSVALVTSGKDTLKRPRALDPSYRRQATMFNKGDKVKYLLSLVPGKQRLGNYRFLPIFFCVGGVMEWIMINVRIGKETFCEYTFTNQARLRR